MQNDKKIISFSVEKVLLGIVDKDSLKRVLGNRSAFLNQLIRKHYNFPNTIETWLYGDDEIGEWQRIRNEWLKSIKKGVKK